MFFGTVVRVLGIVWIGSQPFRVEIVLRLFCWISDSLRRIIKTFENCSQPVELVGKPDQPVLYVMFSEIAVRVLCIVWVSSHSFDVRIVQRLFFLASLIREECFEKISKFFSIGSIGWGIGSTSLSIFVGVV